MKKILLILLCIVMITITACGDSNNEDKSKDDSQVSESDRDNEKKNESVEVDKGLVNVTLTIPASMFEGQDVNQKAEEMKEEGIKEVTVNDDGSVILEMSKDKHKELVKEMKKMLVENFDEIKSSEEFQSIKDVKYDDDFKEITLEVDKVKYEQSFDGMAVWGMLITTGMYHIYDGVPADDVSFKINIKDADTGEVFNTVIYPDDLDNMNQ